MKTRYFEIYVAGDDGFSEWVQTNKKVSTNSKNFPDEVLQLACDADVIDSCDAKYVSAGAGYVIECTKEELEEIPNLTISKI